MKKEEIVNSEKGSLETIKINVEMTTALPVKQHLKRNAQYFAEKFMDKKHKARIFVNDVIQVDFEIIFTYVKVIPEGVDAVFALTKNEKYIKDYNRIKILIFLKTKKYCMCRLVKGRLIWQ